MPNATRMGNFTHMRYFAMVNSFTPIICIEDMEENKRKVKLFPFMVDKMH
jgi:hypothetical protein